MNKEDINNELENIAPGLNRIKKEELYNPPEGYLENFTKGIMHKIASDDLKPGRVISVVRTKIFRISAIAALIAGVVSTVFISGIISKQGDGNTIITENYLIENVDEYELINYIVDNEIITEESNDEIEDYVINNFDENLIIEEL